MSIKLMTLVFERYPAGGSELLLALALADFANDDGKNVFPSMGTLASKTRQSRRNAQMLLRKMQERGFVSPVSRSKGGYGPHKTNVWRINLGFFDQCENISHIKEVRNRKPQECEKSDKEVRNSFAHDPSSYPSVESPLHADLIFTSSLKDYRASIETLVGGVHQSIAQQIVDEVAGHLAADKIRRSPVALAKKLVQCVRSGTFVPELGIRIAAARTPPRVAPSPPAPSVNRTNAGLQELKKFPRVKG